MWDLLRAFLLFQNNHLYHIIQSRKGAQHKSHVIACQDTIPQNKAVPFPLSGIYQPFNKICQNRQEHDTVQPHHIAVISHQKIGQCIHTPHRNCHAVFTRIFFPGIPCHGYAAKPCLDQDHRSDSLVYIHEFHKQQYQEAERTAEIIAKQSIKIISHGMCGPGPARSLSKLL